MRKARAALTVAVREDAAHNPDASTVQTSGPAYSRLSIDDLGKILRLKAEGLTQTQIADAIGCSQPSVSYALQRMQGDAKELQALAKGEAIDVLKQWISAIPNAAKRGDHRPAREFIELAHSELRPQPSNSGGGGGVTIVLGMPGQPVELPSITIAPAPSGLSPAVSADMHRLTGANSDDSVV